MDLMSKGKAASRDTSGKRTQNSCQSGNEQSGRQLSFLWVLAGRGEKLQIGKSVQGVELVRSHLSGIGRLRENKGLPAHSDHGVVVSPNKGQDVLDREVDLTTKMWTFGFALFSKGFLANGCTFPGRLFDSFSGFFFGFLGHCLLG